MKKLLSYLISAMMLISLMIQPIHAQSKILETNQTSPGDGMFMIGVTGEHYAGYKKEILHKLNMLRYTACREHEYDPNYNLTPNTSYTYNLKTDYGENPTDEQLSEYNGDYWPMVWSDVCEHAAEIRASEFTLYGDHIRPNGNTSPCFSFDGVTKNKTAAECLYATTRSYTNPWQLFEKAIDQFAQEKEAYDAYAKGQGSYSSTDFGHYAICINPANVHVGMSALTITQDALGNALAGDDNFTSFVTLEAGYKAQQSSETERNNSGEITQKVEIKQSYAQDVKVPDTITITDGKAQQAKIYASFKRRNDSLAKVVYWPILDGLQSTSSHENVAKMSSDGTITPYGNGTTTITITVNGQSYAFPVTVQGYAHTHTWDDGKITTPATCTEKGVKTYTCTTCGEQKSEEIPALGHDYGDWTYLNASQHQRVCKNDSAHIEKADHEFDEGHIVVQSTCVTKGLKEYTCKDCGYTKSEELDYDKQNHPKDHIKTVNQKEATTTSDGYTGDVECQACHTIIQKGQIIPQLTQDTDQTDQNKGTSSTPVQGTDDKKDESTTTDQTDQNKDTSNTPAQGTDDKKDESTNTDQKDTNKGTSNTPAQGTDDKKDESTTTDQTDPNKVTSNTPAQGTDDKKDESAHTNQSDLSQGTIQTTTAPNVKTNDVPSQSTGTNALTRNKTPAKVSSKKTDAVRLSEGIASQNKMMKALKNDQDLKGTTYRKLTLQVTKRTAKSLKLSWTKVAGTKTYLVYGNKCGHHYRFLTKTKGHTYTSTKLKKGTYYKYMIIALDQKGHVLARSKVVHMATRGGHYGNVNHIKAKKSVTLKKKQSYKFKYQVIYDAKKVKTHRKIVLESANKKVIAIKKGKLIAKKKGMTYVYIYAQDGVCAKVKVKVK